jgi:chromosome segregation ATPase
VNSVHSNDSLNNQTISPRLPSTLGNNSNANLFNATNASSFKNNKKSAEFDEEEEDDDPFVNTDEDDEDEENERSQQQQRVKSNMSGQISAGVGTMVRKSGNDEESPPSAQKSQQQHQQAQTPFDSFYEKQRNASFIDIGQELFSDKSQGGKASQSSLTDGRERRLLELESRIKELEQQKRNYEVAFNNSDRLLAEKEKLISTMNAERFKTELAFKNDTSELMREIAVLRENKQGLESRLHMTEQHSSQQITHAHNETASSNAESYLIKIRALESHVDDLTNDRKVLSQCKQELTGKIDEYEKAIEIVTERAERERRTLGDELEKAKRELGELSENRKRLQNEVDELKYQLHEKTMHYERMNAERGQFEQQMSRDKQDVDKMRDSYEHEMAKMRGEQMRLMERLALAEAKLVSAEKELEAARQAVHEREKQVGELREQLAKVSTELALQLNVVKKERDEKETLLKKCEMLDELVRKNMDELGQMRTAAASKEDRSSSLRSARLANEEEESVRRMEKENKRLQGDVRQLAEKLQQTEAQLENMRGFAKSASSGNLTSSNNQLPLPPPPQMMTDDEGQFMISTHHSPRSPRKSFQSSDNDKMKVWFSRKVISIFLF